MAPCVHRSPGHPPPVQGLEEGAEPVRVLVEDGDGARDVGHGFPPGSVGRVLLECRVTGLRRCLRGDAGWGSTRKGPPSRAARVGVRPVPRRRLATALQLRSRRPTGGRGGHTGHGHAAATGGGGTATGEGRTIGDERTCAPRGGGRDVGRRCGRIVSHHGATRFAPTVGGEIEAPPQQALKRRCKLHAAPDAPRPWNAI